MASRRTAKEPFAPMPSQKLFSDIDSKPNAIDQNNVVGDASVSGVMLRVYRQVPFMLWFVLFTYQPFQPMWQEPAGDLNTTSLISITLWSTMHALLVALYLGLFVWYYLCHKDHTQLRDDLSKAISIIAWIKPISIFINLLEFSNAPWPCAVIFNMVAIVGSWWFMPKPLRVSTHFPHQMNQFTNTLDTFDQRYTNIGTRFIDPVCLTISRSANILMQKDIKYKPFADTAIFAHLAQAHQQYPGHIDTHFLMLTLPIIYFTLKSFFIPIITLSSIHTLWHLHHSSSSLI